MRILSMGAGVQTTACLLKFWKEYDYVVFADTGDEKPETYWYIEKYQKPFCKEHNLEWVTVKNQKFDSLYDHCIQRNIVPIKTKRWCTDRFKKQPIRKFLRSIGATSKNVVVMDVGISMDESHRLNTHKDTKYVKSNYPLIDARMTRRDCKELIEKHGWPLPVKSGCYYCQYATKKEIKMLAGTNPELYDKMITMQENATSMKSIKLFHDFNLRAYKNNQKLTDFMDDEEEALPCDSGHCMV